MNVYKKIVIVVLIIAVLGIDTMYAAAQAEPIAAEQLYRKLYDPVVRNKADAVVALLAQQADNSGAVNYATPVTGETLLMVAAQHNSADVIPLLVAAGAKIGVSNISGFDALLHAGRRGNVAAMKELLRAGADGTCKNEEALNLLTVSAQSGHAVAVRIALAADDNLALMDASWWRALGFALEGNHSAVVNVLLAAGVKMQDRLMIDQSHDQWQIGANCMGCDVAEIDASMALLLGISYIEPLHYYLKNECGDRARAIVESCYGDVYLQMQKAVKCQNWTAQDLIDSGCLTTIYEDKPDAEIVSEKWFEGADIARDVKDAAATCRGSIQQLITRLADCSEAVTENPFLTACVHATVGLNREQRLLALQRQDLIEQGIIRESESIRELEGVRDSENSGGVATVVGPPSVEDVEMGVAGLLLLRGQQ